MVFDFNTGKTLKENTGSASGVNVEIPDNATVCTLHTHPKGGNFPSAADIETYRTRFDGEDANTPSWDYIVAVPKTAGVAPRARLIVTKGRIPDSDLEVLDQINRRLGKS